MTFECGVRIYGDGTTDSQSVSGGDLQDFDALLGTGNKFAEGMEIKPLKESYE